MSTRTPPHDNGPNWITVAAAVSTLISTVVGLWTLNATITAGQIRQEARLTHIETLLTAEHDELADHETRIERLEAKCLK